MGSGGNQATGGAASGGIANVPVAVITGGTPGFATRYWDCCKPHCGWQENVPGTAMASCNAQNASLGSNYGAASACSGGEAHMCWGLTPWAVSATLAYGYAAVPNTGDICGRCYELQFTGASNNPNNDLGSQQLAGKTLIVQATNTGGLQTGQFDLLIPGGGVGEFNACSAQWGVSNADLGEQYGGFFLACQKANNFDYQASKTCAAQKCASVFTARGLTELASGCNWFIDWFGAPDNPALVSREVTCPEALMAKSGLRR
jgi:hypothetical protein